VRTPTGNFLIGQYHDPLEPADAGLAGAPERKYRTVE
jgi:hypothetical protein